MSWVKLSLLFSLVEWFFTSRLLSLGLDIEKRTLSSLCIYFLCSDINKPNLPPWLFVNWGQGLKRWFYGYWQVLQLAGETPPGLCPPQGKSWNLGTPQLTQDDHLSRLLSKSRILCLEISLFANVCQLVNSGSSCFLTVIGLVTVSPPKTLETYI